MKTDKWCNKVIKELLMTFIINITVMGCLSHAAEKKPPRPWPSDELYPFFPSLTYIYPAPPQELYSVLLDILRENGYMYVEEGEDREINRYGKVTTDYLIYEEGGKKYRKQCNASVFGISGYPGYSKVTMTCFWDVYEYGFGRGGIHNLWYLFKWKKDWYSEPGIYAVEDMLELIRGKLGLGHDEVIRPRVFVTYKGTPSFIIRHEAEKAINGKKAKEILFYTDKVGYAQKNWHKVKDEKDKEKFEKSEYKAYNYIYNGRLIKTVIIHEHGDRPASQWEYYFHKNGKTGYLNEKIVSSELKTPEEYFEYIHEDLKKSFLEHVRKEAESMSEKDKEKTIKNFRKDQEKYPPPPYMIERRRVFRENGEEETTVKLEKAYSIPSKMLMEYEVDEIKEEPVDIFKEINELPYIQELNKELD